MLTTLRTLMIGANARAEDRVRDAFALELIDQKIRETEGQLRAAKGTLASLIQRQRSETRMLEAVQTRIVSMTARAQDALEAGREELAQQAAEAIATMENEAVLRRQTLDRLEAQATRLRASVEKAHRRIIDLKQGAITARAIRREQQMQTRLNSTIGSTSSADEAEELIQRVIGKDDPFEQSGILQEIDASLNHDTVEARMAEAGFGPALKVTAAEVMDRLRKT
ncbi:PspA/IM30 family protein [Roseovarius sp. SCSIO 43702]|uniref:PspA/IM30 family protein n=1 Tax=Roseovarius sp. SCSIO 43702 TaxID=2823043 RepID=UPI001C72E4EA|nr:PspA/IM30 family protein [Roseovarius sp. SCSIO 43702]QYX57510.1 PspA/IM30 family protein [Roseovarius sp. SCSIO 43702]